MSEREWPNGPWPDEENTMSDLPFPSGDDHAELMREAWSGDEATNLRIDLQQERGHAADLEDEVAALRALATDIDDALGEQMHRADVAECERDELRAELDAVRPIVEAACKYDEAVEALDAAERPDPWGLLEEVRFLLDHVDDQAMRRSIDAALKWREQNPDA